MRSSTRVLSVLFVGLGAVAAACSSSNPSPGGSNGTDGGGTTDGTTTDQAAPTCSPVAACYSVAVSVSATSPTACGPGTTFTKVADYTTVPAGGGAFTTSSGCTGELSGCTMTLNCSNGEAWMFTFDGQDFTATVTAPMGGGSCSATAVGTRLGSCPVVTGGGDDGGGSIGGDASPADASSSLDANVDAAGDATVSTEAGPGADGGEGGADAASAAETGSDAAADVEGADAADAQPTLEGGDDGGDAGIDAAGE
jgi:hypothetical protein